MLSKSISVEQTFNVSYPCVAIHTEENQQKRSSTLRMFHAENVHKVVLEIYIFITMLRKYKNTMLRNSTQIHTPWPIQTHTNTFICFESNYYRHIVTDAHFLKAYFLMCHAPPVLGHQDFKMRTSFVFTNPIT